VVIVLKSTTGIRVLLAALVMLVGSVVTASPAAGAAATIVPATYADEAEIPTDAAERRSNSLATLDAIQYAIDSAPPRATIQLESGVYDFSAVVNPENEACEFDFYNGAPPEGCDEFGPHRLQSKRDLHIPAYGIVVLGKSNLSIRGAVDAAGDPTTTILGNDHPDAATQVGNNNAAWYNLAFTVGGGSTDVTFQHLRFEQFWLSVSAASEFAHPILPGDVTDPHLAGGTTDLVIKDSVFEPTQWGLVVAGGHHRPVVSGNEFVMDGVRDGGAMSAWGAPGELLVDAQLKGNEVTGLAPDSDGIWALWPYTSGGAIKDNTIGGGSFGVLLLDNSGWQVKGNRVDGAFSGITMWGANDHHIADNHVFGSAYGVWIEWYFSDGPDPAFRLKSSERNRVTGNELTGNGRGVFLGAYARNNTVTDNDVSASGEAGYYLSGAEDFWLWTFGAATGNRIVDRHLGTPDATVVDISGCTGEVCPQTDYDGDGAMNEDPIDGFNNDGDTTTFGLDLVDEDPPDTPNQLLDG
jgi:parallel beta-helix repeat protein